MPGRGSGGREWVFIVYVAVGGGKKPLPTTTPISTAHPIQCAIFIQWGSPYCFFFKNGKKSIGGRDTVRRDMFGVGECRGGSPVCSGCEKQEAGWGGQSACVGKGRDWGVFAKSRIFSGLAVKGLLLPGYEGQAGKGFVAGGSTGSWQRGGHHLSDPTPKIQEGWSLFPSSGTRGRGTG